MNANLNSLLSAGYRLHRRTWKSKLPLCFSFFLLFQGGQAQSAESAEAQTQSIFATSVVLTDSDAIRFGALRFDPGDILEPLDSDDFGSEESIERRQSVQIFALPGSWELGESDAALTPHVKARLSYLRVTQEAVLAGQEASASDRSKERVYGAYLEGGFSYPLTSRWEASLAAGLHLLQYDSSLQGGGLLSEAVQTARNSLAFDTRATALMGEFETQLSYNGRIEEIPWRFRSTYSYYAGETVKADASLQDVKPETWSWLNEVAVQWPMPTMFNAENHVQLTLRRVDVGGDVTRSLGTRDYYAFGVGWIFEGPDSLSWLRNVGVSLFVNWGSAFSGGSADVLYNEPF